MLMYRLPLALYRLQSNCVGLQWHCQICNGIVGGEGQMNGTYLRSLDSRILGESGDLSSRFLLISVTVEGQIGRGRSGDRLISNEKLLEQWGNGAIG